ncbi:MAG: PKD domain-containing protein [Candidatus Bathyarchaeia archaeon]
MPKLSVSRKVVGKKMEKVRILTVTLLCMLFVLQIFTNRPIALGTCTPVPSFTCSSFTPSVDETVTFDASESYDPDGYIVDYSWNFGDGTIGEGRIVSHKFKTPKVYPVTLTVKDNTGLCKSHTVIIIVVHHVNIDQKLDVDVSVGSIYFNGEIAEFYILISYSGKPVENATIKATLYFNGTLYANLTSSIEQVAQGFYRVPYVIPIDAPAGTYAMLVEALKKINCTPLSGVALTTFLISPTLTNWNAWIIQIQGDVVTLKTDAGIIKASLEALNAKLTGIEGRIATIETDIGTMKADISIIGLQITKIEGNIATINTILGDINGTIKSIKGSIAEIQTDIGSIQIDLSAINATLKDITGTLAIIETNIGEIQISLNQINATFVSLNETIATIKTALGTIRTNIENIHAKIVKIEGDLAVISTILGEINGTIVSIQGDIATIKTEIGEIKISLPTIQTSSAAWPVSIALVAIAAIGSIVSAGVLLKRRK